MARFSKRTLGIVAAAAVIGGTALGVAVSGGTAHAQGTGSISLTSSTLTGTVGEGYNAVLTFSVTCSTGYDLQVYATVTEGQTDTGESSPFAIACTGSTQAVTVSTSGTGVDMAPGQAFVGATLRLSATGTESPVGPPTSLAEIATIG
jgi:hypothetical protein